LASIYRFYKPIMIRSVNIATSPKKIYFSNIFFVTLYFLIYETQHDVFHQDYANILLVANNSP